MSTIEAEAIRTLSDAADESQRRLADIRAGRGAFAPGQAREVYYCLNGMIERNASHLHNLDACDGDYWQEMHAVQERLADHLADLREFL